MLNVLRVAKQMSNVLRVAKQYSENVIATQGTHGCFVHRCFQVHVGVYVVRGWSARGAQLEIWDPIQ